MHRLVLRLRVREHGRRLGVDLVPDPLVHLVVQARVQVLMLLLIRGQVHLARCVVRPVPVLPPAEDSRRRLRS